MSRRSRFEVLGARAGALRRGADDRAPPAHHRDAPARTGARPRPALPDPHRAAAAPLRRRRGGAPRRAVRRDRRSGATRCARSSGPTSSTTVAGVHGLDRDRPAGRRARYDFEVAARQVPPRARTTARSRCCCCSPAPCSSARRRRVRGRRRSRGTRRRRSGCRSRCGGTMMDLYFPNSGWLRVEPRHARRAAAVQGGRVRCRPGTRRRAAAQGSRGGRRDEATPARPTASPRRGPSPTPCSTRATCSTRTGPRRRRTRCAGSSACSPRGLRRGRRLGALVGADRVPRRPRRRPRPLTVRVRCLQVQRRIVEAGAAGRRVRRDVDEPRRRRRAATCRGTRRSSTRSTSPPAPLPLAAAAPTSTSSAPGRRGASRRSGRVDGTVVGRVVRRREPVDGRVRVRADAGRRRPARS